MQNLGSRALGRWGALLRAQFYGLTGLGDRTTLAFFTTLDMREQQTVQIGHDFRIGGEGLALRRAAHLFLGEPGPRRSARRHRFAHFVRDRRGELSASSGGRRGRCAAAGGIDLIDQDIEFNGLPLNRDRLRVAFARTLRRRARPRRRQSALHAGGAASGGSADRSRRARASICSARARLRAGARRLPRCPAQCRRPGWRAIRPPLCCAAASPAKFGRCRGSPSPGGADGQYSAAPLAAASRNSPPAIIASGRGYDPGALLGDSGVGIQAELRYGSTSPHGPNRARRRTLCLLRPCRGSGTRTGCSASAGRA